MTIEPAYAMSFLILTIVITYNFIKRSGKSGVVTVGFVGLVVFIVSMFTLGSWWFMISSIGEVYSVSSSGRVYTAEVVSFTSEERYDSEDNRYYTMHTPTVQFTTVDGSVLARRLGFSTSDVEIGETYQINYNVDSDKVITLGYMLVMKFVIAFIFCFIFTFLFTGLLRYSFGLEMNRYYSLASKAGFFFFIPFLMIVFDALLIYGLFYGNEVPLWVSGILVFFILALSLGIFGYLKAVLANGPPAMKRVSANSWEADWDGDNN